MSTASRITKISAVLGAGLLGLTLMSAPAVAGPEGDRLKKDNGTEATAADEAPGGADRETEAGHSGEQGRSGSNPDDAPGVDKPYEADGYGAETQGDSDYDGNNGCGNDTDFADDNNGNCGGPEDAGPPPAPPGELGATDTETDTPGAPAGGQAQVMGVQIERAAPSTAAVSAVSAAQPAELSAVDTEAARAAGGPLVLARTGLPLALLAWVGLALVGTGLTFRRFARR